MVAGDIALVAVVVVISHGRATSQYAIRTGCFSCVVAPLKVFEGVAGIVRKRDRSVGFDFDVVSAEAIGFACDEGKCCAKKKGELHICLRGWVLLSVRFASYFIISSRGVAQLAIVMWLQYHVTFDK